MNKRKKISRKNKNMFNKSNKVLIIPIIFILTGFVCIIGVAIFSNKKVGTAKADDITSTVEVGNTAPVFTSGPAENPVSSSTTPTNIGSNVTFQATATDSNNNQYYLAVCKGLGITPGVNAAPTCTGGAWAISTATNSGSSATATYDTTSLGAIESYIWYAYVCDKLLSGASCSSAQQGSGDGGSPFKLNHTPAFSGVGSLLEMVPGNTATWTTTASDADTDGTADTVTLVVCKTAGITGTQCDGGLPDTYCGSTFSASNPSCSYEIPIPTAAGVYHAYTYVFDSHDLASAGAKQGTDNGFTIMNVAPVVSNVTINSGSNITLNEGSTKGINVTATVTDNNACTNISSVTTSVYRSGIAYANCDEAGNQDDNNCYAVVSCTVDGAVNACDGASDASASYRCSVTLQYVADPTDASAPFAAENWSGTVKATDASSGTHTATPGAGIELQSMIGYEVTSSINYGSLSIGQKNDPLDKITTITNTGNVSLDEEVSGTDMTNGGTGTILVSFQKYALSAATAYNSAVALGPTSEGGVKADLNCPKTTVVGSPETKNTWWGLYIPEGTEPGSYTGTISIVAVLNDSIQ